MEAGSHVTVVSRPRAARSERDPRVAERREGEAPVMVSQFMVELLGTKAVQGEEPLLDTALQPKDPRGFQRPPHDRAQHLLPDAVGAATAVRGVAVAAERGDRLLRLGVDYVDLYQIHWPDRYVPMFGETEYDPSRQYTSVPIEEQLEVLGRAIHVGKVHWP